MTSPVLIVSGYGSGATYTLCSVKIHNGGHCYFIVYCSIVLYIVYTVLTAQFWKIEDDIYSRYTFDIHHPQY